MIEDQESHREVEHNDDENAEDGQVEEVYQKYRPMRRRRDHGLQKPHNRQQIATWLGLVF